MDDKAIINGYVGPAGSGKTYLALKHLSKYPRQIRIDAQIKPQQSIHEGCEVFRDIPALFDFVSSKKHDPFKACYWPENADLKAAFHWIASIAIIFENIAIFADEANRYLSHNLTDAGEAVFFQSRHSSTRLFYTLFNPRDISPAMRGNTSDFHIFQNVHKNVTDFLKEANIDAETLQGFMSETLPPYSYALIETAKKPVLIRPKKPPVRKAGKTSGAAKRSGRRAKKV